MDHRNILATGFLLLCGAVFAQSLKSANASMPVGMQHGQFPYEHFTECDLPGAVPTSGLNYCTSYTYSSAPYALLTVPSDRIFVVTGASAINGSCTFTSDGAPIISSQLTRANNQPVQSPLLSGNGHLTIASGSTLEVVLDGYCQFYIEGYYAHL